MPGAAGPSVVSLVYAALFIVLLLASGWWTDRRYRRFDRLPAHYDFTGHPTRMDSRRIMAWLLPVMFSVAIIAVAGLQLALPVEAHGGNPSAPLYILPPMLLGAHASVLWLLHRWAARQPRS